MVRILYVRTHIASGSDNFTHLRWFYVRLLPYIAFRHLNGTLSGIFRDVTMPRDLGYSWKCSSWSSKQSCMKNWSKLCGGTNRYMTLSMSTRISSCRRISGGALAVRACVLQEVLMILQEEANLVGMQISWPKTKLGRGGEGRGGEGRGGEGRGGEGRGGEGSGYGGLFFAHIHLV